MLKNKIILAVIAVIIALGLAGCRAEKIMSAAWR